MVLSSLPCLAASCYLQRKAPLGLCRCKQGEEEKEAQSIQMAGQRRIGSLCKKWCRDFTPKVAGFTPAEVLWAPWQLIVPSGEGS